MWRVLFSIVVLVAMGFIGATWYLYWEHQLVMAAVGQQKELITTQRKLIDTQTQLVGAHTRASTACVSVAERLIEGLGLDKQGPLAGYVQAIGGSEVPQPERAKP